MGWDYIELTLDGKLSRTGVKRALTVQAKKDRVENGTRPRVADWQNVPELKFSTTQPSYEKASEYIKTHSDCHTHCIALRYKGNDDSRIKWLVGAWAHDG